MKKITLQIEFEIEREIPDLTDKILDRIYLMDGVAKKDMVCRVVEESSKAEGAGKQPEALRLADALKRKIDQGKTDDDLLLVRSWFASDVEATLRTQHALLEQAREALKYHVHQTRPIHRTTETLAALNQHFDQP